MSGSTPLVLGATFAVALAAASSALADGPDAARAGLRYLDWPGKTHPRAHAKPVAGAGLRPSLIAAAAPEAPPPPTPVAPGAVYDPPAPPQTPMTPAPVAPAITPAVPAVAVAPAAPVRLAADAPRRYSLHRDYGETPDAAPQVIPTFLDAPPVDLAAPPPPNPTAREVREAMSDAADPDRVPSVPDPQDR